MLLTTNCGTNRSVVQDINSKVLLKGVEHSEGTSQVGSAKGSYTKVVLFSLLTELPSVCSRHFREQKLTDNVDIRYFLQACFSSRGCRLSQCSFLSCQRVVERVPFKFRAEMNYAGQHSQHSVPVCKPSRC